MKIYFIQGFRKFNYADYTRNRLDKIYNTYDLDVLDISHLINRRKLKYTNTNLERIKENLNIYEFQNSFRLISFLYNTPKKSVFICDGLYVEAISLIIYLIIKFKKSYIVKQGYNFPLNRNYIKSNYNSKIFLKLIIKKFINIWKLFLAKYFMIKVDFYIYNGFFCKNYFPEFLNKKSTLISTYSYEHMECKKKECAEIGYDYGVFLDQSFGYHPETLGLKNKDYENYYKKLENLFSYLENRYNLKIIIAAHPLIKENGFQDRVVYKNQTSKLINKSKLVIGVSSSSIIYPILLNKKMLLICSDIIKKLESTKINIAFFEDLLDIEYQNIDSPIINSDKIVKLKFEKRKNLIKNLSYDNNNFKINPYKFIENEIRKNNFKTLNNI